MFNITPTVRNLLIANVLIFLLQNYYYEGLRLGQYLQSYGELPFMEKNFSLLSLLTRDESGIIFNSDFRPWMLVSYMFLHGDFGHIFFNMLSLVMFGSVVESFMGSKKFLRYYLITGVGAAVLQLILHVIEVYQGSGGFGFTVGASGGTMGILMAYGYKYPDNELIIMPIPFPIKAKYVIAIFAVYSLFSGSFGIMSEIAHFAHIGGLITGFILLKYFGYAGGGYNRWR
jgi:membrane associated rhomboid family serine protease